MIPITAIEKNRTYAVAPVAVSFSFLLNIVIRLKNGMPGFLNLPMVTSTPIPPIMSSMIRFLECKLGSDRQVNLHTAMKIIALITLNCTREIKIS